jgi:hypothetical protein
MIEPAATAEVSNSGLTLKAEQRKFYAALVISETTTIECRYCLKL